MSEAEKQRVKVGFSLNKKASKKLKIKNKRIGGKWTGSKSLLNILELVEITVKLISCCCKRVRTRIN